MEPTTSTLTVSPAKKPIVIGLYGLPGSGKSFLMNSLKYELESCDFCLFEGSEVISAIVPGGLAAFKVLDPEEKSYWRGRAITEIGKGSAASGKAAVVTGHYMFREDAGQQVAWTCQDSATFTHVIYLDVSADCIAQRRLNDKAKTRPTISTDEIQTWQETEMDQLRSLCRSHRILFTRVPGESTSKISALVRRFGQDSSNMNSIRILEKLDEAVPDRGRLDTVLVFDADRTLAAEDTGTLFWKMLAKTKPPMSEKCPLKELFGSPLEYSDQAFRQATLMYEEATDDTEYHRLCETVASSVTLYPEFDSLLRAAASHDHVGAVVITCGLGRVWNEILQREGLSGTVKVIGGGRLADGFIVTPQEKAAVVSQLRHKDALHVYAFGDSPLDLPMLLEANEAIVVVGDERTRSRSMDDALDLAIGHGIRARQMVMPDATPRLDEKRLPRISLSDQDLVRLMMRRRTKPGPRLLHSTNTNAARLLMSPTRDAAVSGSELRRAHQRVGRYLATQHLSDVVGLETYEIRHVQGSTTSGHRLRDEAQTIIMALMRGGEPMAFGINDVFQQAMFFHADSASDVDEEHLRGRRTVILVDSVVNTGKTLLCFIERIRQLEPGIRIVVVTAVLQEGAVVEGGVLSVAMERHDVRMIALRLSENKFTGTKGTDTGNRLFNTTHLK
ncbi:uracil phosphoribosyltransferase [Ophiocordyceps camponoti-floridani]|uniref:Uracil phosphoribosyltransferase n=1 Tax=Ophiocordyceps camponoti-floridani TaxID=2030778 RepID=A0A8H4QB06_9HYPO|nr:uracil phosphoribosyltransferase [Ophiocordyceps camponoti-floridani]